MLILFSMDLANAHPSIRALVQRWETQIEELARRQVGRGQPLGALVVFVLDVQSDLGKLLAPPEATKDGVALFATSIEAAARLLSQVDPAILAVLRETPGEDDVRAVLATTEASVLTHVTIPPAAIGTA